MESNKKVDVSVILVNYNTKQMTSDCIDSIMSHTRGITYEIILVDNASKDGSREFFTDDPRVIYVYSEKNGGFGYGNNLGMEHSHGKYIFLLNTDTLFINNAIKEFYDYAESHEPNTVYGCWLVGRNGKDVCSYYNFPAFTFKDFLNKHIVDKATFVLNHNETNVDAITGADMFIPRRVIEAVGGFNTNIFMYGEEGEYQYRMMKVGIQRQLIPQPQIIHFEGGSSHESHKPINMEGHFVFLKLHMPWWKYLVARLYYCIIYFPILLRHMNGKWARKSWKFVFQGIRLKPNANIVELTKL